MTSFSITRDKSYPFFCNACLVGKPEIEMSKDKRYCQHCHDFLNGEEYKFSGTDSTDSKSTILTTEPIDTPIKQPFEVLLPSKPEEIPEYQNPTRDVTINLGGRPKKDIPIKLVKKLSKEGIGVKAIARELGLSPMMVSRVLSGQRT